MAALSPARPANEVIAKEVVTAAATVPKARRAGARPVRP
jgi:hypothetical protein